VLAGSGDPGYLADLQRRAQRLDLDGSVFWPGFLSGDEKLAALEAANLFVLPSHSENFGVAAVEALAAGLPVVLSEAVGIAPDVARAGAGMVVPLDSSELSKAMIHVLDDTPARAAMSARARLLATERFSVNAAARDLIQLYRAILEAPGWRA
jgi:glycosyltransferase involved in cell wall biosynthesis